MKSFGKKALVTGGAGFIGSHLCEKLLSKGYKVVALDNFFAGSKDNLVNLINNNNFELIEGDVRDKNLVHNQVKRVDIVYHLASIVGVSAVVNNPLENISVNIEGVKNTAEAALASGKKRVVFTSSSEVYGKNNEVPLTEDLSESIFGSTKVTRWAYGKAKAIGEQLLWAYAELGLPVTVVRLFNCYGPRGINKTYANVVPKFIKWALENKPLLVHNDGRQTRCFCYVEDTVNGIILAADKLDNDVANIGSDKEISIYSLAKRIIRLCNSKSKINLIPEDKLYDRKYEGAVRRVPNIKKARKFGFEVKTDLNDGLKKTIGWTKKALIRS